MVNPAARRGFLILLEFRRPLVHSSKFGIRILPIGLQRTKKGTEK